MPLSGFVLAIGRMVVMVLNLLDIDSTVQRCMTERDGIAVSTA